MRLDDLPRDVETETEPLLRLPSSLEALEDACAPLGRDPRAVIADDEASPPHVALDRHLDGRAGRVADRVLEEVRHDLVEPEGIPSAGDRLLGGDRHRTAGRLGGDA